MMKKLEIKFNFLQNKDAQFEACILLLSNLPDGIEYLDFFDNHLDRLNDAQLQLLFISIPPSIKGISLNRNHLGLKI
jgi:hypothetical protein